MSSYAIRSAALIKDRTKKNRTKCTGQKCTGQNAQDKMHRTKCTGQNAQNKMHMTVIILGIMLMLRMPCENNSFVTLNQQNLIPSDARTTDLIRHVALQICNNKFTVICLHSSRTLAAMKNLVVLLTL